MKNDPLYDAVFMAVFSAELRETPGLLTADNYETIIELAHSVAALAVQSKP